MVVKRFSDTAEPELGAEALGSNVDNLATDRTELAAHDLFDHRDGLWTAAQRAVEDQVTAKDPLEAVADFVLVHQHSLVTGDVIPKHGVQRHQHVVDVFMGTARHVQVRNVKFLVGMEVVRRRHKRDDLVEAVLTNPDDLFMATDPPMARGVATRALADRDLVLQHPRKISGLDAFRPFAAHAGHCTGHMLALCPENQENSEIPENPLLREKVRSRCNGRGRGAMVGRLTRRDHDRSTATEGKETTFQRTREDQRRNAKRRRVNPAALLQLIRYLSRRPTESAVVASATCVRRRVCHRLADPHERPVRRCRTGCGPGRGWTRFEP